MKDKIRLYCTFCEKETDFEWIEDIGYACIECGE